MSGADIFAICHEASITAIGDHINNGLSDRKLEISARHFETAVESVKSRGGKSL
jgi:SpoVK/Ycf46/Vps4 family AAA+-type ATPase